MFFLKRLLYVVTICSNLLTWAFTMSSTHVGSICYSRQCANDISGLFIAVTPYLLNMTFLGDIIHITDIFWERYNEVKCSESCGMWQVQFHFDVDVNHGCCRQQGIWSSVSWTPVLNIMRLIRKWTSLWPSGAAYHHHVTITWYHHLLTMIHKIKVTKLFHIHKKSLQQGRLQGRLYDFDVIVCIWLWITATLWWY